MTLRFVTRILSSSRRPGGSLVEKSVNRKTESLKSFRTALFTPPGQLRVLLGKKTFLCLTFVVGNYSR